MWRLKKCIPSTSPYYPYIKRVLIYKYSRGNFLKGKNIFFLFWYLYSYEDEDEIFNRKPHSGPLCGGFWKKKNVWLMISPSDNVKRKKLLHMLHAPVVTKPAIKSFVIHAWMNASYKIFVGGKRIRIFLNP